eukprot:TRINITY_DN26610_c0_g1_i1.p1 TRINITY_DN26610_c0_g1~~TRINITY_DN26610_c0_g1_i1.p1  ORF type:complete len:228 (+),score=25.48 TRINITY_DN26610_c0_g1_i1:77-685(+)
MILTQQCWPSLFCLTFAVLQAAQGQVLEMWEREEDGGGIGPVILCPVDMNSTYPPDGYCAEFVDYRYCPAFPIPCPNRDSPCWTIGDGYMDAMARATYKRALGSALTKHSSVSDACLRTLQAYACYDVFRGAADSWSRLVWTEPCRSNCYEIKNNCWVQEQCQKVPDGACTKSLKKSTSASVRPGLLSLLLVGLLSISFVLS